MIEYLILLFVIILSGLVTISQLMGMKTFAPWVPSKTKSTEKAFKYIRPKAGQKMTDLGCGDGRILFMAQKKFDLNCTGYEINIVPYALAKIRQLKHLKKPITIKFKDLYSADLSDSNIIYIYGLPRTIENRLFDKLEKEARPGTWIISYNFLLKDKPPVKTFNDRWRNVFVYRY